MSRLNRSTQFNIYAASIAECRLHASTVNPDNTVCAVRHFCLQSIDCFILSVVQHGCAYVQAGDLDTHFLLDEEIAQFQDIPAGEGMTDIGMMTLFIVRGAQPAEGAESEPAETPNDEAALQPEQDEPGDAAQPLPDSGMTELLPPDENADELALAAPGEYVSVTTDTRVFDGIDAYAVESNVCAGYLGQFVRDATVHVISAELDERGNGWYEVRFLYGDDFADGTMKWTDYATCFVMAAETGPSDGDACTVTDFAYSRDDMRQMQSMSVSLMSIPMNGFSLKNINGSVGGFYAGQSSLYGSSGKDSAYPQIAKSPSHGTIYATPHYGHHRQKDSQRSDRLPAAPVLQTRRSDARRSKQNRI